MGEKMNNLNKQHQCEVELNKLRNVLTIEEFQPIVKMCTDWLSQRDETKFEKTNKELLERCMDTLWLKLDWSEIFTCRWINKYDLIENTEKGKCWKDCATNYLKNKIK